MIRCVYAPDCCVCNRLICPYDREEEDDGEDEDSEQI